MPYVITSTADSDGGRFVIAHKFSEISYLTEMLILVTNQIVCKITLLLVYFLSQILVNSRYLAN